MRAAQIVHDVAKSVGATASQVALAWLLSKGEDIVPIPGTKRRKFLDENAGAVNIHLSTENLRKLNDALRPEAISGPRYNEKQMQLVDR